MTTHTITITHANPAEPGAVDAHALSAFLAGLCDADTSVNLITNRGLAKCDFTAGPNRGRVVNMDGRFILETITGNEMTASPVMDSMDEVRETIRGAWKDKATK